MRRMRLAPWTLVAVLFSMRLIVWSDDRPAIQSFDPSGLLLFTTTTNTVETYQIEWTRSLSGTWRTGHPGAGIALTPGINGTVTGKVSVGEGSFTQCFFRVVAATNSYLVIDISGGTNATTYPVSFLSAVPTGGWSDEYKTTKLVLRFIPAGTFVMGYRATDYPGGSDNGLHNVTLTKDFYIGVFEVTQRQWELVMGNRPSWFTNAVYYPTRPVEAVSYYDIREGADNSDDPAVDWPTNTAVTASSFMGRLRAKTGLMAFDLPTESQWEYACRGGTTTALNSGQNLTNDVIDAQMAEVGRYYYNGPETYGYDAGVAANGGTSAVGLHQPNGWGLYDMHGNVWEWCLDWYGDYPEATHDPAGPAAGTYRDGRGGSWLDSAMNCRSATRSAYWPSRRDKTFGLRVACTIADDGS